MTKYETIRKSVEDKAKAIPGMSRLLFSHSEIPNGTISVGVKTQEELDVLAEILTDMNVDHLRSPVSTESYVPFSMYFREEDLVFALMDKNDKDMEEAETEFISNLEVIEDTLKRFVSYNDFIRWYFVKWIENKCVKKGVILV
jgi:hypothetical protein